MYKHTLPALLSGVLFLATPTVFAQLHVHEWSVKPTFQPLNVPNGTFEVRLEGSTPGWGIGFHIVPSKVRVASSIVSFKAVGKSGTIRIPEQGRDIGEVSPGVLTVRDAGQAGNVQLVIVADIVSGTTVRIVAGGTTVFQSRITSDLMNINGTIVPGLVFDANTIVMNIMHGQSQSSPRVWKGDTGKVLANFAAARQGLLRMERPVTTQKPGKCCGAETAGDMVLLEVEIDASGAVAAINPISGNTPLAGEIMAAVRTWVFRPFSIDGKAVPVTTRIPFRLIPAGNTGKIISPVLPN